VIAVDTIGPDGWGFVLSARAAGALLATVVMVKLTVRRPMVWALSWRWPCSYPYSCHHCGESR
jgi:hypothetical protein